jgi:tetratricopeptide (TPR) repeat protein
VAASLAVVALSVLRIVVSRGLYTGKRWAWRITQVWVTLLCLVALSVLALGFAAALIAGPLAENTLVLPAGGGLALVFGVLCWSWRRANVRAFFDVPARVRQQRAVAPAEKYRQWLNRADRLLRKQKVSRALALYARVIQDLTASADLTPEHRQCLGLAYLAQGQAQAQQGDNASAAQSYLAAQPLIPLPAPALVSLALQLASQQQATEQALAVYLDYLRLSRGQPQRAAPDPVYAWLQNLCHVDDKADAAQRAAALALTQRVLDVDGSLEWAHYYLGLALVTGGDYTQAISPLETAVRLNPTLRAAAYLLARAYALTDQFAQAVPLLTSLAARPDATAGVFYALGCAHANLEEFPSARDALSACVRLAPSRWQAYLQRGHCHLAERDWEQAQADYQQALTLQPEAPEVALALARYHLVRGEAEAARCYAERVLQTPAMCWEGHMLLGALAEQAHDAASAEAAYQAALQTQPARSEPYVRLGLLACHQGRYREAWTHFSQLVATPEALAALSDAVLFHGGYARAECGDPAGALEMWTSLQQRHPEDQQLALNLQQLRWLLGHQYAQAGRYEAAIAVWEECRTARPHDETLRKELAELYFRLGVTRMASGNSHAHAQQELQAALQLDAAHPLAPFYLALWYLVDGQPSQAASSFARLAVGPPSELQLRAMYHQGIALLQAGQPTRATSVLQAVAAHPCRAMVELPVDWALAVAHARSEQWEEALAVLEPLVS